MIMRPLFFLWDIAAPSCWLLPFEFHLRLYLRLFSISRIPPLLTIAGF